MTIHLTQREVDVLSATAWLKRAKLVGRELGITDHTVGEHLTRIYRKLGVHRRSDAVKKAKDLGLIGAGQIPTKSERKSGRVEWRTWNVGKTGKESPVSRAVIRRDPATGEEQRYESVRLTAQDGFAPSCVCGCCRGRRKQHADFEWRYA